MLSENNAAVVANTTAIRPHNSIAGSKNAEFQAHIALPRDPRATTEYAVRCTTQQSTSARDGAGSAFQSAIPTFSEA